MDRFVIRQPVAPREVRITIRPPPPAHQTRIEDLAGVVSLSRVEALRDDLQALYSEGAAAEDVLRSLRDADAMHIALEVLETTQIGKAVHKFCRHADARVKDLALAVQNRWMKVAADGFETRARRERKGLAEPQRGAAAAAGGGRGAGGRGGGGGGGGGGAAAAAAEARKLRQEAEEVEAAALQGYVSRLAAGAPKRPRGEGEGGSGSGHGGASPAAAAAVAAAAAAVVALPPPPPPPPPPQRRPSAAAASFFAPRGSKPPPALPAAAPPPAANAPQQQGRLALFELS